MSNTIEQDLTEAPPCPMGQLGPQTADPRLALGEQDLTEAPPCPMGQPGPNTVDPQLALGLKTRMLYDYADAYRLNRMTRSRSFSASLM